MKKALLLIIALVLIALVVGAVFLIKKPASVLVPPTGGTGTSDISNTLNLLSSGATTSETNDAAVISDSGVVDSSGLT